jgi:hypothetical protein
MLINLGAVLTNPVTAALLSPLVAKVVDKVKHQVGSLDKASPAVKQATAFAVGGLAAVLGKAVQVDAASVGALIQSIDPQTVANAVILGLGAVATKQGDKLSKTAQSSSGPSEIK